MIFRVACLLVSLAFVATQPDTATWAAEPTSSLPLPEMVVARTQQPPRIDGTIAPGEWDRAAACTAFVPAFKHELSHIQSVAWCTYDDEHLYVCLKNSRGPTYTMLKKRGRLPDEEAIVFDTSNEIWFTPPASPAETYQTLLNTYPGVFDVKMIPSVGYRSGSWNGDWQIAASETRDHWIVEARAPIKSFGHQRIGDGATWRALFCTDVLGGAGFTAWAPGGGFAEINRHGWLHFRDNSPTFQFLDCETIFAGRFSFPMTVTGPAKGRSSVKVTARFGPGVEQASGDLVRSKDVAVADGQVEAFRLDGDLTKLGLPRDKDNVPQGYCEVKAVADGRTTLYRQVFPFALDGYRRTPPAKIVTSPYDEPIGVTASYAPLGKKLIVKIDRLYFDRRADVAGGTATLIDPGTKKVVARRPIAPFYYDYSQFPIDLARLDVPIEGEAEWQRNRPTIEENDRLRKENQQREKQGQPPVALKRLPFAPAEHQLRVVLTDADGAELVAQDTAVALKGYRFEWLPNSVGISDKVIPPWTPLEFNGRDTIEMWNKRYSLDGLGLARSITNDRRRQLSGAMRLVAVIDGKETTLRSAEPPKLKLLREAYADLTGTASAGDLRVDVDTRVEFDGCVQNTMRIVPQKTVQIDRLSLVVTMPKSEAECFATTAGGWDSTFGWTPDRWDSRDTSGSFLRGNFVPYVFLTDSDRGFCWFADNERGWILDSEAPTIEIDADDKLVTFRANFVTRPGEISQPTTVRYGWMVTPQKPQPPGWRCWKADFHRPFPEMNAVFWGMDQTNWAVLWPYYASPYPWDYEKSKPAFDRARESGLVLGAGNIAHAIARYRDYKGRWFNEVAADWGMVPGELSNGNVALGRGPNDFRLWHWDRWIRQSGLNGLYFDETYLPPDRNYLTGGAYLLPDERVQPGYNYLGLREMCKRIRYLFHQHGLDGPRLWFHTTAGHPVYAWMPDVSMEGENVEPTGLDNDYLECLPASRLRAIGMGRNLGTVPLVMTQAERHWDDGYSPFCVPQMVGWLLAHDCLPEASQFWDVLAVENQMWRDDVTFRPYWKEGQGITSLTDDVVCSAHTRRGHALLWIVNQSRSDRRAKISLDLGRLGQNALDRNRPILVFDAETGERYALASDKPTAAELSIDVPKRFWRAVRLVQPARLRDGQTFAASFDSGDGKPDESLGYGTPLGRQPDPAAVVDGRRGKGVSLDQPLSYMARHHVTRDRGRIAMQLHFDPATARGALVQIDRLELSLGGGKLVVSDEEAKTKRAELDLELPEGPAWHPVEIAWEGRRLQVAIGNKTLPDVELPGPMPLKPQARGLGIRGHRPRSKPAQITFGRLPGAVIDDLVMGGQRL